MSSKLLRRAARRAAFCAALVLGLTALGDKEQPTRLDINAQPEGAQVFVDGKLRGAAPCQIFDLAPGEHLVHVAAPSCKPADEFVRLGAGAYVQKSFALTPEKGLVLIQASLSAGAAFHPFHAMWGARLF